MTFLCFPKSSCKGNFHFSSKRRKSSKSAEKREKSTKKWERRLHLFPHVLRFSVTQMKDFHRKICLFVLASSKGFKIWDIFYKINKFLGTLWASIIPTNYVNMWLWWNLELAVARRQIEGSICQGFSPGPWMDWLALNLR